MRLISMATACNSSERNHISGCVLRNYVLRPGISGAHPREQNVESEGPTLAPPPKRGSLASLGSQRGPL